MNTKLWLFLLALVCPLTTEWFFPPTPRQRTGNDVLEMCQYVEKPMRDQSVDQKAATIACLNYTSGFMAGVLAGSIAASSDSRPIICPSEEVTAQQVSAVVLKYLRDHPEDRHESAVALVYIALAHAFPCK